MDQWLSMFSSWLMSADYRQRFSLAIQGIIEAQGLKSVRGFAKKYGLAITTVRQWVEMETFPNDLKSVNLIATLRGQDLKSFFAYLEGQEDEEPASETVDDVFERARRLRKSDRIQLVQRLVEDLAND